jgi:hypothetical protein
MTPPVIRIELMKRPYSLAASAARLAQQTSDGKAKIFPEPSVYRITVTHEIVFGEAQLLVADQLALKRAHRYRLQSGTVAFGHPSRHRSESDHGTTCTTSSTYFLLSDLRPKFSRRT